MRETLFLVDAAGTLLMETACLEREILARLAEALSVEQERRYWAILEALRAPDAGPRARRVSPRVGTPRRRRSSARRS